MPIEIKLMKVGGEDLHCPIFICDVCQQTILDNGNYEFGVDEEHKPTTKIYFTHKQCGYYLKHLIGCERTSWDEIKRFAPRLQVNLNSNPIDSPLQLYLNAFGETLSNFVNLENTDKPGLYFLFDDDNLIYIGQSENIKTRLSQNHHVYKEYHQIRIANIPNKRDRNKLEKAMITLMSPKLNVVYNEFLED